MPKRWWTFTHCVAANIHTWNEAAVHACALHGPLGLRTVGTTQAAHCAHLDCGLTTSCADRSK